MSKKTNQPVDENKRTSKLSNVFLNLEPNSHLLHLSLLRQLNNKRAGTASTKTKAEVRGGGKKPWAQKGTGRARVGSIRSPLWVGGGITFGPKPRSFKTDMPQRARNLAIAQAISSKENEISVIKNIPEIKDSKTKNFISAVKSMEITKPPILFICEPTESHYSELKKASRNVPFVIVKTGELVGVYEILKANTIVITEKALLKLDSRLSKFLKKKTKAVA